MIAGKVKYINEQKNQDPDYVLNPKRVVLWLFMVASMMLFAAFTSAYIVRRGEGNWEMFSLPSLFAYNTGVIILGSIFMQWAYFAARKDELLKLKITLSLTLLLGIIFTVGQWFAWAQLVNKYVYFAGNPSGTFVYVISGIHLAHVFTAVIFVLAILVQAFRFRVHKKNMLYINLCTTWWHFIGLLWVYLYFFMLMYR